MQLREQGIVLLRGAFPKHFLAGLHAVATRCFEAVDSGSSLPERYQFNPYSHSVLLAALLDFGCDSSSDLLEPLFTPGLSELFSDATGGEWTCRMQQSWVRKKHAPARVSDPRYHLQDWHQDGALGVSFPLQPGPAVPMTRLLTCWIPLNPCGTDSPGLEFVRRRQNELLHFTELEDTALRRRFQPEEFWTPNLELGDGLVFLNGTLHRTHVHPRMRHDRLSVEYRIFSR